MDLNAHELAELEERLYSSIHHADAESTDNAPVSESTVKPLVPAAPADSVRIVTDKSIINNARQTASSKIKRYWDSLQQQNNRMSYPGISKPKRMGSSEGNANECVEGDAVPTSKIFTPYQSILGPKSSGSVKDDDGSVPPAEKQKKKKNPQGDGKRTCNLSGTRNRKMEQLKKLKGKKAKALKSRQKAASSEHRLVATIDLDTSSEEEGEYRSPDPIKQEKETVIQRQDLEDSDPDEVVLIPTAPPPLVCIVDSEDEVAKDGFTHPKSKKKKQAIKINSPRCVSPSNSSIMSDDFIGQSDRTRLNDSFIEGITNDEELDCTAPHTVGSLLAGERRGFGDISRQSRAPSISSDGTVATSSDTTDPDKRNGLKQNSVAPFTGQSVGGPKVSSTPKQTLTVKKSTASSKTSRASEDDSIYTATSVKKSKPSTEKRPSSGSSDESEGGNVSSHSKRSKSCQSDTSSTKSLMKRRQKRRKQDSEHYSDEDFASMLTDIVQAISENEEEESSDEETPVEMVEQPAESVVEEQVAASTEESVTDHSNDVQEVEQQEPQNQISLPQVEPRKEIPTPVEILEESNDASSVVAVESVPPPLVNLVDEDCCDRTDQQVKQDRLIGFRRDNDDPECCWNDEMRKFYNDSWNCEDFNISTVLFNMPRSSKYWPIVHKDKYPDPPKKEIICNNCGERGHIRYKCRSPPKPKTCYMCGLAGHQEVRCPNTLCLKCGEKTKNFLRGCHSCSREQNMTCHLCGVRGHGQRNCPDKWRRYHSTIEDNKPLTHQYVRNPNAKHCCICSRAGHQAHTCNAALKIFGQLVPTTEVKSYQPLYHINERYRQQNQNHGPKYNLFSDMTDYRLNFDASFATNENSFYYRFAKSVGIVEEKKRKEEKLARKLRREAKKRKTQDGTQNDKSVPNEPVVIDEDSRAEDQPNRSNVDIHQRKAAGSQAKALNDDSNYSFSEFYEDKAANLPQSSDSLPDYIPLVSCETSVVPTSVEKPITDAKIFLTKPHAKILLGPIGATFLKDASSKFALKVSISFQSVGNVLLANGLSADQDNFHNELVKFLNDASHQNEQLKLINNVPKATEKTIRYITEHLLLLIRSYENAKILFKRYQHFEEQGANAKTCDKIRRTLNIILFGQYGMRAGREHLTKLQSNLKDLQNTQNVNVSADFRDEINQHIRYIFTSFDHANYGDILNEYDKLRKNKKLNKVKPEDLNLPSLAPGKGSESSDKPIDDSFDLSNDLNFDERNSAVDVPSSLDEDLILNTSDQLIDPSKTPADSDEQSDSDQSKPDAPPAGLLPNPTHKVKHSSKKHRVDTLLDECSHMVRMLNSPPITSKFERISSQTRQGYLSKANYRTLLGIHTVLRGKLNRKLSFRKKGATV